MQNQKHILNTNGQLGQILQASRKANKWSQAQLAKKLGLSQSRVSHLELHPEELSFAQLMNWCAVLGLELSIGMREVRPSQSSKTDW
ncbi:helix-turn-helix domain-containing protein [uncultured Limnobacter sp.]|jgi:HTH-type transcriptional regulator/antitoxin HipB|uniref:helix-turn-helix domain-containing protein n=1 Tax=uncultured Limnobacter sp. TaxID=199681 RepID=UPI0030F75B21